MACKASMKGIALGLIDKIDNMGNKFRQLLGTNDRLV
jgi:hypothetical protein